MNEIIAAQLSAPQNKISFSNNRPGFRRLVMRGAMLELVTAGFYRFWLATDMRRHLWSHTSVEGDTAEYTGTAKELLIGFLFALTILVPIYIVYFLIGLEAERLQAFASIPLVLLFYLFMQFAVYRARRYRLTRTVWRGVRFSMVGSGLSYAWRAALWSLFAVVTLGLALPWRQAALERFKMRHTSYGELQGRFDGKGWGLFKRSWWLWLIPLVLLGVPLATAAAMGPANSPSKFMGVSFVILLVSVPFAYSIYKAIEWRWWFSGIRFGQVSFESNFEPVALIGIYCKVIGWSVLLAIGLSGLVGIVFGVAAIFGNDGEMSAESIALVSQQAPFLIGVGVAYVVTALAFGVVMRIYLMHDVWKRVTEQLIVHNLAAADNLAAQGQLVGALGEGLADSLDVGGF